MSNGHSFVYLQGQARVYTSVFFIMYSTSKYLALLHNVVGVAAGEASTLQQVHHIALAACVKRLHAIQGY